MHDQKDFNEEFDEFLEYFNKELEKYTEHVKSVLSEIKPSRNPELFLEWLKTQQELNIQYDRLLYNAKVDTQRFLTNMERINDKGSQKSKRV